MACANGSRTASQVHKCASSFLFWVVWVLLPKYMPRHASFTLARLVQASLPVATPTTCLPIPLSFLTKLFSFFPPTRPLSIPVPSLLFPQRAFAQLEPPAVAQDSFSKNCQTRNFLNPVTVGITVSSSTEETALVVLLLVRASCAFFFFHDIRSCPWFKTSSFIGRRRRRHYHYRSVHPYLIFD